MKNLETVPKSELIDFINSIHMVFCDVDGVIWRQQTPLPGARDCVESLKKLGKPVKLVTNNGMIPSEQMQAILSDYGFSEKMETDVIRPQNSYFHYLRTINFNKTMYLLTTESMKEEFRKAGFAVAPNPSDTVIDVKDLLNKIEDDENVGAVLFDLDLHLNLLRIQKALTYLKRADCLFLSGGGDRFIPATGGMKFVAVHQYLEMIKEISGRNPVLLAKPSEGLKNFLLEEFKITKPKSILFVGDSIPQDMEFADQCGFRKLLVLSGVSKIDDIKRWAYPENQKPDYYIEDLKTFDKLLKRTFESL